MYMGTHTIVLTLFPVWFAFTIVNPEYVPRLKKRFGQLLFVILHKKLAISGFDNVNVGKRYLIVANYPSGYAGFVLMMLFPEASIIVHAFISKVPMLSKMLSRNGFIYAYQRGHRKIKNAINSIIETSLVGSIIILPEGKRTSDGEIQEFKSGVIHILRNSSLDLLPVTLSGFYRLKPMNRLYLEPDTELEVTIHKPINQSDIRILDDAQLLIALRNIIESCYKP